MYLILNFDSLRQITVAGIMILLLWFNLEIPRQQIWFLFSYVILLEPHARWNIFLLWIYIGKMFSNHNYEKLKKLWKFIMF